MRPVGVALVGLGPGSQPHRAALHDLGDSVSLRWAVSRSGRPSAESPLPAATRLTTNIDEALSDPLVDLVIIATPAATHPALGIRSLQAGKHTLVEKPLATSLAAAEELVALAQSSDRHFGVVLQHRFRPAALRLRTLIDSGTLGPLQAAHVRVPWWRSQEGYYAQPGRGTRARDGGGVLLTQAIHAIDLFRSLVGVQNVVAAQTTTTAIHTMETEDYAAALLTLGNGAPGMLLATTAQFPGRTESLEFIFSRATATLAGSALQVDYHDGRSESLAGDARSGSGDSIMDFSHEAHRALIQDFLSAIADGRASAVGGADALATHRLIETIVRQASRPAGSGAT